MCVILLANNMYGQSLNKTYNRVTVKDSLVTDILVAGDSTNILSKDTIKAPGIKFADGTMINTSKSDSSIYSDTSTFSRTLQGKDTTDLDNAELLQGVDTTYLLNLSNHTGKADSSSIADTALYVRMDSVEATGNTDGNVPYVSGGKIVTEDAFNYDSGSNKLTIGSIDVTEIFGVGVLDLTTINGNITTYSEALLFDAKGSDNSVERIRMSDDRITIEVNGSDTVSIFDSSYVDFRKPVKLSMNNTVKYIFAEDSSVVVGLNRTLNTDETIYVRKNTGSDINGDGSVGSPYATLNKALRTFDRIVDCNVTIDFDTVDWDNTTQMLLSEKSLIGSGKFIIQGSGYNTIISSVSFTTDATITQKYAATGTFTVAEDELVGYYVYDGNNSYPIIANSAGTNSSDIYHTRGEKSATLNIVEWQGVINLLVENGLDYDFKVISNHEHLIKQCKIVRTGNISYFNATQSKEYEEVHFDMTGSMEMGEYATSRYFQHSFRNCLIQSSGSSIYTLRTIRYNGYMNLFRTAVVNTVNATGHVTPILTDGYANTMYNLFDVAIRANNTGGIKLENLASIYIRGEVMFYNCSHALYVEYPGYNPIIYSNPNQDDHREFNLVSTPYVINNLYNGFEFTIDDVNTDGTYNFCECTSTELRYIDQTDRIDIDIRDMDIYRENDRMTATLIDNATTNVTIGDSLQNNCILVEYCCSRSDSSATGRVSVISSAIGLKTSHDIESGYDIGLSFSDSEYDVDDKIIFKPTLTSTGSNAECVFNIKRNIKK